MPERSEPDRLLEQFLGFSGDFSVKSHYPGLKLAERSLVESEARLRAMFSAVPFGMYMLDGAGRFLMANEALGSALEGKGIDDAPLPEAYRLAILRGYRAALEGRLDRRTIRLGEGGRGAWLLSITAPVTVGADTHGAVGIGVDISDRVAAEDSLRRILGSIAHELNTPIAAMVSASGTFLSLRDEAFGAFEAIRALPRDVADWAVSLAAATPPESPASRSEYLSLAARLATAGLGRGEALEAADHLCDLGCSSLGGRDLAMAAGEGGLEALRAAWRLAASFGSAEVVATAARRSAEVVRYLSAYLAIERPEILEKRRFDLGESVLQATRRVAVRRGVSVLSLIPPGLTAEGDPASLEYVWENLIRNAAQAADALVEVSASVEDGYLAVSVVDDGPGVDPAVRLFSGPVTTRASGEGKGLGLDIARRIIDTHGGTITYSRSSGRTVFEVRLPEAEGANPA